jgi:putative FmdB family regulatory protein
LAHVRIACAAPVRAALRAGNGYSLNMALYEYRCLEGHSTEVFHRIEERPAVLCEVCGTPAERVLSPPMIHTQYYFSPQVHGARRPRYRPTHPAEQPADDPQAAGTARRRPGQDAAPKTSS